VLISDVGLTIELGRFPDKTRIKVIRKKSKNDSNLQINEDDITIVSTIKEVELENDAIEAIEIWNACATRPFLKEQVYNLLRPYVTKKI
jgi:hypothetical protein